MNKPLTTLVAIAFAFTTACTSPTSNDDAQGGTDTADQGTSRRPAGPSAPSAPASSSTSSPDLAGTPRTTDLHVVSRGDPKSQPVVFVHGGPGANSVVFELTVHDAIANLGFRVVTYDQRGSTRSPKGTPAEYSYAKATQDLDDVVASLGLVKPILVGHSFGGALALHYLERFPGKAKGAVLVASPIDFPQTYDTILVQCASRYRMWGRFSDAQKADELRARMFPRGVTAPFTYGSAEIGATLECQSNTMLFFTPLPTKGDVDFMLAHGQDANVQDVNPAVGPAFHDNDKIGHASYTSLLTKHKNEVVGIYAQSWDVMFSKAQLATIQANTRAFFTVPDAGHLLFVDQPEAFVSTASKALSLF
jgi:proline iminopeptidase